MCEDNITAAPIVDVKALCSRLPAKMDCDVAPVASGQRVSENRGE
jgi:hypothetical protein